MGLDRRPAVRVARGATLLMVQGVVSIVAGVVYLAVAARLLPTVGDLGRLATIGLVQNLVASFMVIPLGSAVTKFVAEAAGAGRSEEPGAIFGKSLLYGSLSALVCAGVILGAADMISTLVLGDRKYSVVIRFLALDVFFFVLSPFFGGFLQGQQRFRTLTLAGISSTLVRYGASIFFLQGGLGLLGIIYGWVLGDVIGVGIMSTAVVSTLHVPSFSYPLRPLIRYSAPLYANDVVAYGLDNIDRYLILGLAGSAALGLYTPAVTIASVLGFILGSIGSALLPQLAEFFGNAGPEAAKSAARMATRYVYLIYTPLVIGLAAISLPTITIFVGARYSGGAPALAILAVASAPASAAAVYGSTLLSLGRTSSILKAFVISFGVDAAFAVALVPSLGVLGAALARAALGVSSFVVLASEVKGRGLLPLDLEALAKSHLSALIMAGFVLALQFVFYGIEYIPLYVLVGGIVYMLSLRFTKALKPEDWQVISAFLPSRFRGVVSVAAKHLS